jgi:hypothetical protein
MVEITKTVRNVDLDAYRVFRAKAVELGYSTGAALTEALRLWVNARERPRYTVRAEMAPGVDRDATASDQRGRTAEPVAAEGT